MTSTDEQSLVLLSDQGIPVADSLTVAEKFGKDHKYVLRDIRDLIEKGMLNFELTPYVHPQNVVIYNCTKWIKKVSPFLSLDLPEVKL